MGDWCWRQAHVLSCLTSLRDKLHELLAHSTRPLQLYTDEQLEMLQTPELVGAAAAAYRPACGALPCRRGDAAAWVRRAQLGRP